ncbi:hypothetical protein NUW54_g1045 [Trametes sanguinea]|uniref:Uncharacterized protein n=1 Tax=Trametes sanguinea TaxID=158606 RepID=A0ACC1QAL3_9APHY|nr:hypothetical protein NUW54_g1045 [Trametes sanguinea]
MATHTSYYYLITYYYNPVVFTKNVPWTTALVPLFGPIANAIAECFELHSIVATVGAGGWLPPTGAAFLLAGDVQLTATLVYFLQRGRSGIKRTDSMVNTLIMYAISTGSLVCVINTVSLILALVFPHQVLYAAANMVGNTTTPLLSRMSPLSSIASSSEVLTAITDASASLNTRALVRARGELDDTHFDTGVVLSDGQGQVRAMKQAELPLRSLVFARGTSGTQLTTTESAFYDSQTDGTAAEQDENFDTSPESPESRRADFQTEQTPIAKARLGAVLAQQAPSVYQRSNCNRKLTAASAMSIIAAAGDACPTQDVALTDLLWAERESSSVPSDARGTAAMYHDTPHFEHRDRIGMEYTNPVGNDYLANFSIQNATGLPWIPLSSLASIRSRRCPYEDGQGPTALTLCIMRYRRARRRAIDQHAVHIKLAPHEDAAGNAISLAICLSPARASALPQCRRLACGHLHQYARRWNAVATDSAVFSTLSDRPALSENMGHTSGYIPAHYNCHGYAYVASYYYLVTYYFNPLVFTKKDILWTAALVPVFGSIGNLISESKLIGRTVDDDSGIMRFLHRSVLENVFKTVQAFTLHIVANTLVAGGWLPTAAAALLLGGDIQLTAILVYVLHKGRSGIKRTDSMVDMLIMYAISTGSLICVLNTVSLVLSVVFPHDTFFAAATLVAQTVYSNSFVVAYVSYNLPSEEVHSP